MIYWRHLHICSYWWKGSVDLCAAVQRFSARCTTVSSSSIPPGTKSIATSTHMEEHSFLFVFETNGITVLTPEDQDDGPPGI